ncbi:MAG: metal ABC transporter permease [Phycisphaeraceae bacterium]|nr:metal ABC transporter permease [Phycisphaeraceae bacterium]
MNTPFVWMWELDGWIIAAGVLCAMSCALVGNFLVLRKMSMMGDAISHAVLPGIAAAFLISQSRDSVWMFLGAAIVGVLTAVLTQGIHKLGRVDESAAMGVVFTSLFALGLVMIVRAADKIDLDPSCVLYGSLEATPGDLWSIGPWLIPRAVVILAAVFLANLTLVAVFFKELRLTSFDPALADSLGISTSAMQYLLMTLTAVTTVASFESVGSIIVIAMLIVPPATAYLLTDRLGVMVLLSLVIAVLSGVLGHLSAVSLPRWFGYADTSTTGMMAATAGLLFATAVVFSPSQGLVARWLRRTRMSLRIVMQDVLGVLYRVRELHEKAVSTNVPIPASVGVREISRAVGIGGMTAALCMWRLRKSGRITSEAAGYLLTPIGLAEGRSLVRSHRLWETYLRDHLSLPIDHLHAPAETLEHFTGSHMQAQLDEATRHPRVDPQGQRVPKP